MVLFMQKLVFLVCALQLRAAPAMALSIDSPERLSHQCMDAHLVLMNPLHCLNALTCIANVP
jgi:hypothetical protein